MAVLHYLHNISWTVKILDKKLMYSAFIKLVVLKHDLESSRGKKLSQKSFLPLTRYTQYEEQRLKVVFTTVVAFWKMASSYACNQQCQWKGGETILADTTETC